MDSPNHAERDHAPCSPSGFAKWGNCGAALPLEETLPPEGPKPYADWGTKCHELAEAFLLTGKWPEGAEPEQYDVAKVYTDYCQSLQGTGAPEAKVTVTSECYGTADYICDSGDTLEVVDLKAGISPVSAQNNGQGMIYLLGAAGDNLLSYKELKFTIIQPRVSPAPDTFTIDPFELLAWKEDVLLPAIANSRSGKAQPSESACQWCRAKPICTAYSERVTALAQQSFAKFQPKDIATLTPEQMGQIVPHLPEVRRYLKDLEDYVKNYMTGGGIVPGLRLVQGRRGARKWKDDETARKFLIRKVGKAELYDYTLKSPAKIEKILKSQKSKHTIDDLVEQKPGSPTIALESDKRPSISSGAEIAFKDIS